MTDDRAAVRRNGRVVVLTPAAGAGSLFLTYDLWTDGAAVIRLRDTGRVVDRGHEFSETVATLELTEHGRTTSHPGRLNCGS